MRLSLSDLLLLEHEGAEVLVVLLATLPALQQRLFGGVRRLALLLLCESER
jgi:hypothetical protein